MHHHCTFVFHSTAEVIDASLHLTAKCYAAFYQHCKALGCKVTRREADAEEREGVKTKKKLYFISLTVDSNIQAGIKNAGGIEAYKAVRQADALENPKKKAKKNATAA